MSPLYELIQGLSAKDFNTVKSYLHFFAGNRQGEEMLSAKLFDYLRQSKEEPSDKDCCLFIYATDKDKQESIKKLKYRLKSKILDSLLTDMGEDKKDLMDEVDYAAFRVKKKSIQARLLFFSNPKLETARDLLDEIIAECKKFEFYTVLVEHLDTKRWRYGFRGGEKEFDKINTESSRYKTCADALAKANDYYYKLVFASEKYEKNETKIRSFLTDAIADLSNLAMDTKSNMVRYYLKFFEIHYYTRSKNYLKARDICFELTDLIIKSPAVKRKQRLGIAYDYFSRNELHLGNFEKAADYARKAQENFVVGSYDHSLSKEQEFYALFYNKEYDEALDAALAMLNTASRKELGEFKYARYSFYYANALFKQGKFSEAAKILSQKWEITDDKEQWETELRILSIMTAIELGHTDSAALQTESLRKFIQRAEKTNPATPRNKAIVKLLQQAERKMFEFDKKSEFLEQLSRTEGETAWELLSPELIPFHQWVKERIVWYGKGAYRD